MKPGHIRLMLPFLMIYALTTGCGLFGPQTDVKVESYTVTTLTAEEYTSETTEDQFLASGSLMIQSAGEELKSQGISLKEVEAFKTESVTELQSVGALAINNFSLKLNSKSKFFNPYSYSGHWVLNRFARFYLRKKGKSANASMVLRKLIKAISKPLSKIKRRSQNASMKELYFAGAVTKITATGVSLLDDFGTPAMRIPSKIKAISSDIISSLSGSGVISSNADLVKKIIAGTIIGSKNLSIKNAATISNSTAMEIYNDGEIYQIPYHAARTICVRDCSCSSHIWWKQMLPIYCPNRHGRGRSFYLDWGSSSDHGKSNEY